MTAPVRILLVGDPHLRDRPPSSCTDEYIDDLFHTLEYVAKIEKKINADAVVWAGDTFDHKQPGKTPHKLMLRVMETAALYDNLYVIAGNHDLTQDRIETLFEQQPLGVLLESGYATFLDGWAEPNSRGRELPLYGVSWQQRWHHEGVAEEAFEAWREDAMQMSAGTNADHLAVTHCAIYPPGQENEWDHFLASEMARVMNNEGSLYYGHIHEDHGIFEVDGVTFANSGAISRGSLTEANRTRQIKVTLWEQGKGFTQIPIPALPAERIFRLMEVDTKKADKLSLDNFLDDVGHSTVEITSIESLKSDISKRLDIEPPIRDKAIEMIETAND